MACPAAADGCPAPGRDGTPAAASHSVKPQCEATSQWLYNQLTVTPWCTSVLPGATTLLTGLAAVYAHQHPSQQGQRRVGEELKPALAPGQQQCGHQLKGPFRPAAHQLHKWESELWQESGFPCAILCSTTMCMTVQDTTATQVSGQVNISACSVMQLCTAHMCLLLTKQRAPVCQL